MNEAYKGGGPAFPITWADPPYGTITAKGMTLRDYFAASALQGLLGARAQGGAAYMARTAYEYADAMIAVWQTLE